MFWNLNVGDVVKIEKKPAYTVPRWANFFWHDGMDKNIGKSVTVRNVSERGFGINEDNYYYPFSCLDRVDEKINKLTNGGEALSKNINVGDVVTIKRKPSKEELSKPYLVWRKGMSKNIGNRVEVKSVDGGSFKITDDDYHYPLLCLDDVDEAESLNKSHNAEFTNKVDKVGKSEKPSKTRKIEDLFFESIKEYHEKRLRINQMFLEMLEVDNAIFPTFVDDLKKIIEAIEDKGPF